MTVQTVRGSVEIDVLATETVEGRQYKNLIECKNWNKRVPKSVVHSFRTAVTEIGANIGYIVSKKGFQAGAHEAAANTNIKLLSWIEFQEIFEDQWYWTHLTTQVYQHLDPLCSYLEPLPAMIHWDNFLNESEVEKLKEMYHQHFPLGALIMCMLPFMKRIHHERPRIILPLGDRAKEYGVLPGALTSCVGYREFLVELLNYSLPILSEFQSYRDTAFARRAAIEL